MKTLERCAETCRRRKGLELRLHRVRTYAQDIQRRLDAVTGERDALQQQMERLQVTVRELRTELYGRRTERRTPDRPSPEPPPSPTAGADAAAGSAESPETAPRRRRGQQPGRPGHGRHRHPTLPPEIVEHELPESARRCPHCGAPYRTFDTVEGAEEIDWRVQIVRRVHRRKRYTPTCHCANLPAILTAPGPARPIAKGLFSSAFLAHLAIDKFLLGIPIHRQRMQLAFAGFPVSAGTLTGALQRVEILLDPWYQACVQANQDEPQLHADETRWPVLGPDGYRGWLWVFGGQRTTVFQVRPTRGGQIVHQHLLSPEEDAVVDRAATPRILISDFYGAYQQVERAGWIWAGCWAHARRPIVRVAKALPDLAGWGAAWQQQIGMLYQLHRTWRRASVGSPERADAEQQLRRHLGAMQARWTQEIGDPAVPEVARQALALMARQWDRLTHFLAHPTIPLDNNAAERSLRTPVVGRKNFQGSRAPWAARLAAMVWTWADTARQAGRDPFAELTRYFEACAAAGGRPLNPDGLAPFLWWETRTRQEDTS